MVRTLQLRFLVKGVSSVEEGKKLTYRKKRTFIWKVLSSGQNNKLIAQGTQQQKVPLDTLGSYREDKKLDDL